MARRLRLGLDIDDVVFDFIGPFQKEAERAFGEKLPGPPKTWECSDWGFTKQDKNHVLEIIEDTENWYLENGRSLPGVPQHLPRLCEEHDVFFISSRLPTKGISTLRQTQMHLSEIGIKFPTVLITNSKGPLAKALDLDAFVDDRPRNLEEIDDATDWNLYRYLMTKPYNETYSDELDPKFIRVKDFEDFVDHIERLSNE